MKVVGKSLKVGRISLTLLLLLMLLASSMITGAREVQAAPAPPGGLTAVYNALTERVDLSWTDNSNNEVGFHIETATNPGFLGSIIFTVPANTTTYSDSTVYAGDTFYYRVASFDNTGDSAFAGPVSVEIPLFPPTAPVAPSHLTGTIISQTQINLTWTDNSIDETGFLLERATNISFTQNVTSFTPAANDISFSDTSVSAGTTYFYRLSAFNTLGSSPYANILVITVASPNAPSGLTATPASENQINLTWADNSNNESGFRIERSLDAGFSVIDSFLVGPNSSSYHDTPVQPATTYFYRVVAVNALGEAVTVVPAFTTTPDTPIAPAAPTNLAAAAISPTRVDLSWMDNSNNETGFVIQRAEGLDTGFTGPIAAFEVGVNAISFSDPTALPNTQYHYRVFAVNDTGTSGFTNTASVTTPPLVPAAPSALSANIVSASQVNLVWQDNAVNETGFTVQRASDPGFTTSLASFDIPVANATSYSDIGTVINTTYYYRVFAYNTSGNSLPSEVIEVTTHVALPSAPTGLSGVLVNPNRIDLSWTDTSPNEYGFHLDTALDPGFTVGRVLITLPANTTTYSDLSVYRGDTFYYRVSAFNHLGESQFTPTFSLSIPAGTPEVIKGPTNLTANALHGNRVDLSFIDNSQSEVGFLLERAMDDLFTLNPETFIVPENEITGATVVFTDDTVAPFNTYFYRVRAFNAAGSSLESEIATVTTPEAVPSAPGVLSGTVISGTAINLTWMDASAIETGFRVERATNPAFTGLVSFTVPADVTTYTDDTPPLVPGTVYYYRVWAFNTTGDSIDPSNVFIITAGLPAAPSNLSVTSITQTQINLAWTDNSDNETTFRIERATSADFQSGFFSDSVPAGVTVYNDTTIAVNTLYFYRVYAVNGAGDSSPSNVISLESLPGTPANLTASALGAGQVDLTWEDNATNETGFRIERATNDTFTQGFTSFTTVAGATSYSDITTGPNTTYYYRVFSFNDTGDSEASNTANVTTPTADPSQIPASPSGLVATLINNGRVDLSWDDNSANETGFRIYTALDPAFTVAPVIITVPAGTLSYMDLSVYPGDTFYYQVTAFNIMGESLPSNQASVTIPLGSVDAPFSPGGLNATVISSNRIDLFWVDNSDDEVNFLLERALNDSFTLSPTTFVIPENAEAFSDETVLPAQTYYYRIMAYNALGISAPSNTATAFTPEVRPAAPSNLTAFVVSANQVSLTWTDNSNNETEFRIERSTIADDFTGATEFFALANATSFNDMTAQPGTTYYYRVIGVNAIGDSDPSNTVSAVLPAAGAPDSPTGLSGVVINANRVDLTWTDNSTNETGFRVERATDINFTQNLLPVNINTPNITSHIDNTTVANNIYYYRVFAFNDSGDSGPSNVIIVNTGVPASPGNLRATLFSPTQVSLAWNDNSTNETSFRVDRAEDADFNVNFVSFPLPFNSVTYLDTVVTGNTYYYRVVALNSNGASVPSNTASILVAPPAAASDLSAVIFNNNSVDLFWKDNANSEEGFQIDRATNPQFSANLTSFFAGANSTTFRNTGLLPNITYYYRVIAYNAAGDAQASNTYSIAISLPAAPSNLLAVSSGSQIELSWTDNATNETGYRIERALDVDFTLEPMSFSAAANAGSYTDTQVASDTTYFYRVFAFNALGDSAASNISSATTAAVGAHVEVSVTLQGPARPPSGWAIPLTVKFFTPGANVLMDTPVYIFDLTTTQAGSTAVVQCTNINPGIYDISAVSEHTLTNVKRNVLVMTPGVSVNLGTLIEGNANDTDNEINILDFIALSLAYNTQAQVDPDYNPMADFDRNGVVNALDLILLSTNYLMVSPIEVP